MEINIRQIEKKGIQLRALTKDDGRLSWSWRNNTEIRHFYSGHPFMVNQEKEEEWLEKILNSDMTFTSFGIEELKSNCLIGMTFLKDISCIDRLAEFSIFIGSEDYRGRGYGKLATKETLEFAFRRLNLNRVFLKVHEDNHRAIHVYEACGFKKEGLLRECIYKDGQYKNQYIMSILKSEYNCYK